MKSSKTGSSIATLFFTMYSANEFGSGCLGSSPLKIKVKFLQKYAWYLDRSYRFVGNSRSNQMGTVVGQQSSK